MAGIYLFDDGARMLTEDGSIFLGDTADDDVKPCACCLTCNSIDTCTVYLPTVSLADYADIHEQPHELTFIPGSFYTPPGIVNTCYWCKLFPARPSGDIPKMLFRLIFDSINREFQFWFWFSSKPTNTFSISSGDHRVWTSPNSFIPIPPVPFADLFTGPHALQNIGDFGSPPWFLLGPYDNSWVSFTKA